MLSRTVLSVLLIVLATVVGNAGPITVSGGGTWADSLDVNVLTVAFGGGNGVEGVSIFGFWVQNTGIATGGAVAGSRWSSSHVQNGASVNGQRFAPGYYDFLVGWPDGQGYANGYDTAGNVVQHVDIVNSYVTITSQNCYGGPSTGPRRACDYTFVIGTPEPGTLGLVLLPTLPLAVILRVRLTRRQP